MQTAISGSVSGEADGDGMGRKDAMVKNKVVRKPRR